MRASKGGKFDAIITGMGIAGLSVAIALARRKQHVLILGKKRAAGESSPAAAGILDPFLERDPPHPLLKLTRQAFFHYPARLRELRKFAQGDVGYAKTGMLYVAFSRAEETELKRRLEWQRQSNIPVVWQSRAQVLKNEPLVNPRVVGGLFYPTIGRVRPRALLKVLYHYARSLGIRILKTKERPRLLMLRNRVQGVQVGSYVYPSQVVINATGAWAGRNTFLGPKPPIVPARGQILIVKGGRLTSRILHSLKGFYIVPWKKNTYLLGSTVEFAGFSAKTTRRGIQEIKEGTERLIPRLEGLKWVDQWAGLRPFPQDRLPFVGPTSIQGLYWALGFYRSGILIGPYVGELMAQGILSGRWPRILKPFDPRRGLREN